MKKVFAYYIMLKFLLWYGSLSTYIYIFSPMWIFFGAVSFSNLFQIPKLLERLNFPSWRKIVYAVTMVSLSFIFLWFFFLSLLYFDPVDKYAIWCFCSQDVFRSAILQPRPPESFALQLVQQVIKPQVIIVWSNWSVVELS